MYEASFGLDARPFSAFPKSEQYYASENAENALHTIARCIEREEGPSLLIGAAGSGKTLLCKMLAAKFQDSMRVATLAVARICTRRALLQNVLLAMRLPYRGLEEDDLRLQLLEAIQGESAGVLLIVDEAQTLPLRLLDELRMLTNINADGINADGRTPLRLVLAGDTALEERFTSPKLESFNQRIAARCYLSPLDREETKGYVCQQILTVGGEPGAIFSDDALDAIYTASHGTPRIINQVCDHALLLGSLSEMRPLAADAVEEAWADLQQLPAPVRTPQEEDHASIIEFGALETDELDDDTHSAVAEDHSAVAEDHSAVAEEHVPTPLHIAAESLDPNNTERRLDNLEQVVALVQSDAPEDNQEVQKSLAEMSQLLVQHEDTDADSFRPAGIVGPETEIIFHGTHHPFDDEFEDEEIVLDHYASLDSAQDPGLVRVASDESREIANLLDASLAPSTNESPTDEAAAEASPDREAAELPEPPPVEFSIVGVPDEHSVAPPEAAERETIAQQDAAPEKETPSAEDRIVAEAAAPGNTESIEAAAAAFVRECSAELAGPTCNEEADPVLPEYVGAALAESSEASSNQGSAAAVSDDRDLIVVEDEIAASTPPSPPATARRMEYRRLFAKLRSG